MSEAEQLPINQMAIENLMAGQLVWGADDDDVIVQATITEIQGEHAIAFSNEGRRYVFHRSNCYAKLRHYWIQQYLEAAADLEETLRDADEYREEMADISRNLATMGDL